MKIGNVELKNAIALAPMAGVTDLPFRLLCKEQGCGLMYTEMVSAKALLYKNRNTKPLLETRPEEEPVAVQLFGSDPEIMSEMALRWRKDRMPSSTSTWVVRCPRLSITAKVGTDEGSEAAGAGFDGDGKETSINRLRSNSARDLMIRISMRLSLRRWQRAAAWRR